MCLSLLDGASWECKGERKCCPHELTASISQHAVQRIIAAGVHVKYDTETKRSGETRNQTERRYNFKDTRLAGRRRALQLQPHPHTSEERSSSCEGGVAAERDLDSGGEPAQAEVTAGHERLWPQQTQRVGLQKTECSGGCSRSACTAAALAQPHCTTERQVLLLQHV